MSATSDTGGGTRCRKNESKTQAAGDNTGAASEAGAGDAKTTAGGLQSAEICCKHLARHVAYLQYACLHALYWVLRKP